MAFNINLGALSISIGLDTSDVEKGIKDVKVDLGKLSGELRSSTNKWGKWAVAATAAATAAAAAIVKSNLSSIRELRNVANAANLTVAEFQRGSFAAEQFGISTEKYGDILKDVNDRIGDFITTGAGPMVDFFEQIGPKVGVTIEQFKKLSGQEALGLFVQSLQDANISQQEMTFFMEALASDSTRLIPLFQDNAKAMRAMDKEARDLGIGLSKIDVAKAIEAQKALDKAAFLIDNELKKATADLAPFITAIATELTDAAAASGGFAEFAIPAFEAVGGAVAVLGTGIHAIGIIFKGIEVIGRGVTAGISVAFLEMAKAIIGIGNTILEGWSLIFQELGGLVGSFSDDAADVFKGMAAGIESIKGEVPDVIQGFANSQIEALARAKDEMQALAMEPIPTQTFERFIADVKAEAAAAAPEIAASLTGASGGLATAAGTGMDQGDKSEADRIREQNVSILEALLEESSMREETLLGRLEREAAITDQAFIDKEISASEHARIMNDIQRREEDTKMNIVTSSIDAVIQALGAGGKKATKAQKALAVINAIIKGKQAAVDAWQAGMSVGGPFAPLAAASYAAASLAQTGSMIRSIKGGGSSTSSGGGSLPATPTGSISSGSGGGGGGGGSARDITINMVGGGAALFSAEQVRSLIGQINEQTGDGVNLVTTGG